MGDMSVPRDFRDELNQRLDQILSKDPNNALAEALRVGLPNVAEKTAERILLRIERELEVKMTGSGVCSPLSTVVERYIRMLGDREPGVRISAVSALAVIKDPAAVPALIDTLQDDDPEVRTGAARALVGMREITVVPALTQLVKYPCVIVRREAAIRIGEISFAAATVVSALIEALRDEDADVRHNAALSLGRFGVGARDALVPLLGVLEGDIDHVRGAAIEALKEMRDPAAIPALVTALTSREAKVRWLAAEALGAIGPEAGVAVPTLIAMLNDTERGVRRNAAWALGRIGDPRAIEPLRARLGFLGIFGREWNEYVRESVIRALKRLEGR